MQIATSHTEAKQLKPREIALVQAFGVPCFCLELSPTNTWNTSLIWLEVVDIMLSALTVAAAR